VFAFAGDGEDDFAAEGAAFGFFGRGGDRVGGGVGRVEGGGVGGVGGVEELGGGGGSGRGGGEGEGWRFGGLDDGAEALAAVGADDLAVDSVAGYEEAVTANAGDLVVHGSIVVKVRRFGRERLNDEI
jgi:hypothetical protein